MPLAVNDAHTAQASIATIMQKLHYRLAGFDFGLAVEIQSATTDASQRVKSRLRIEGGSA